MAGLKLYHKKETYLSRNMTPRDTVLQERPSDCGKSGWTGQSLISASCRLQREWMLKRAQAGQGLATSTPDGRVSACFAAPWRGPYACCAIC